ncbi:DNA-3-methyladenine glycosylase 2 family protein [Microbacterium sp. YMB-B2]|uniref:DNA-3-methyladenine glycosylase II n=1 Tax=Microbacterium tenebrionis TaxID=2830665 RepID=A0A9X1RZG8_9MICO|nr:Ada metal-binding domain-containing protein [Microbacterium tenebrionis]MCC2029576.1 DNA-3-methyladenine glycosylase 2 family protein [Microbacterium tenebrionis]
MSFPIMSFDERYRAIDARDTRFDGQFVTAVHSTGIYCRPSCPARTPKRENVSFYPTSAAAHEAGFRACKRCLPEAAPGSPAWDVRGDAAARAMRLIADGVVEREGVSGLAARLGYSSRHLTRLLTAELGAGPLALARAHRAHNARMLLVGTDLPIADIAFSAGFASIRQAGDTIREVFGLTPTELRAKRRQPLGAGAAAALVSGEIDLLLPHREPMDAAGIFAWMAVRAVPGVEVATADSFSRHLRMPGGPAWFEVRQDATGTLRLRARVTHLGDLAPLVATARRIFDLDADPVAVDAALSEHPLLAPLVGRIPGIRVPGAADPHEMLIRAMIGQQITVAAARTALTALTVALGEEAPDGGLLFPAMTAIAERGAEVLRGPAARIRAVTGAAAALADGTLALTVGDDSGAQRAALLAMPGIGPWTADYVRMRVLGDPDIILPGDVAIRSGAAAAGIPSEPAALTAWAERTAPWRSYLSAHLWAAMPPRTTKRSTTKRSTAKRTTKTAHKELS